MKLKDLEVGRYFKFDKHGFVVYEKTSETTMDQTTFKDRRNQNLTISEDELNKEVYNI